jgi:ElaB/YqjD/DUF883 family membrane-anchored ribosome-binding protein
MAAVKSKRAINKNHVLYDDVEKIKAAISDASYDVKDKVNEIFSDSLGTVREQSDMVRENVSNYTAERPFKSLSIVLLTGVMLGYLIHRQFIK